MNAELRDTIAPVMAQIWSYSVFDPDRDANMILAAIQDADPFWDRVDDAIETAVWDHERQDGDQSCRCGAVNNMDGDVLPSHRVGAVTRAVQQAFFGEAS